MGFIKGALRRFPPIRRRDEKIAALQAENNKLSRKNDKLSQKLQRQQNRSEREIHKLQKQSRAETKQLEKQIRRLHRRAEKHLLTIDQLNLAADPDRPSFRRERYKYKRIRAGFTFRDDLSLGVPNKFITQAFAQSHGVDTPRIYGHWVHPSDIDWDSLPDQVVLKLNRGSGSKQVLPIIAIPGTQNYSVWGHDNVLSRKDIERHFEKLLEEIGPPGSAFCFAEEFLLDPNDPTQVPTDVKVMAFQGEIGHIMLRRPAKHDAFNLIRWKFVNELGEDLGNVLPNRAPDPDLPIPERFFESVEVARKLSLELRVPFARFDLYGIERGVVLGEITRSPGGRHLYIPDHDLWLGQLWERSEQKLLRERLQDGEVRMKIGNHPIAIPDVFLPEAFLDQVALQQKTQ